MCLQSQLGVGLAADSVTPGTFQQLQGGSGVLEQEHGNGQEPVQAMVSFPV